MAATRIMPLHIAKGKTAEQCMIDRISYILNPEKTENGTFVRSYGCEAETADVEFAFSWQQYQKNKNRVYDGEIIAYHIRQSFQPGEITPEEANAIGYEFASRYLKGKYAFIVATHTDKAHIHNHIIVNAVSTNGKQKLQNRMRSIEDVQALSDQICEAHQKSVIEDPQKNNNVYSNWIGFKGKPNHRDLLREDIDHAMAQKPRDFDELIKMLEAMGYTVRYGKHISLKHLTQRKPKRLDSLGDGYTEADLRDVLSGKSEHRATSLGPLKNGTSLLIDIHRKMAEGKGKGYEHWAKIFNLKQMAQTVSYLQEHDFKDYDSLLEKIESVNDDIAALQAQIAGYENRMQELTELRQHILNYAKNSKVYAEYKRRKFDRKFFEAHQEEINKFKDAKRFFDTQDFPDHKLPSVKQISDSFEVELSDKRRQIEALQKKKAESRELIIHQSNIEAILGITPETENVKDKGHTLEKT